MTIEYAILGLLSWRPLTGYDIKKVFAGTAALYWSDNNNQIYRILLKLYCEQLVEQEIQVQENYPARKIYRITEKGREELRKWAGLPAELPVVKQSILIQLAWADLLDAAELESLVDKYEEEIQMQLWMCQSEQQLESDSTGGTRAETYIQLFRARTAREAFLWQMIQENWIGFYQYELAWVRKVRRGLEQSEKHNKDGSN